MTGTKEAPVFGEFPVEWPFSEMQEDFLAGFLEEHFRGINFDELVGEEGRDLDLVSTGLAIDFRSSRDRLMSDLYRDDKREEVEQLRGLGMEDVAHFAHNQILECENVANGYNEGSDGFIEANNEAFEWLKIARLAEYSVFRSPACFTWPGPNAAEWPY